MDQVTELYSKWEHLTKELGIDDHAIKKVYEELIIHYSSNNRAYHNITHISQLLQTAEEFKNELEDYNSVLFAIWFHDVIYNPSSRNNESLSANYAEIKLTGFRVPLEMIKKIKTMILATKNHMEYNPESNSDLAYFLDFDLKILGSSQEDYLNYSRQIRKEYHSIPDFLYRTGRKKVLESFLNAKRLYKTDILFKCCEQQARTNIQYEISQL